MTADYTVYVAIRKDRFASSAKNTRFHLTERERVFISSLLYHGFRLALRKHALPPHHGYVIPGTMAEDAIGIDLWVRLPHEQHLIPIQLTQRGTKLHRHFHRPNPRQLHEFIERSAHRLLAKQQRCFRQGIVFVLVRDHVHSRTNRRIAWGDVKALRYGIRQARYRDATTDKKFDTSLCANNSTQY